MSCLRHPSGIAVVLLAVATLASIGPHLAMLSYRLAGATPPAALLFVCPLHHLSVPAPSLVLHAKPFVASR